VIIKYCRKCGKETERSTNPDGSIRACKLCLRRRDNKFRARIDRLCAEINCKAFAYKTGKRCQRCAYEHSILKNYNLTLEDYGWLAYKQDFCCKVCNQPLDFSTKIGAAVDHCHKTNKVRGILHSQCNQALGLLNEDPVRINQAATYLTNFKITEVHREH